MKVVKKALPKIAQTKRGARQKEVSSRRVNVVNYYMNEDFLIELICLRSSILLSAIDFDSFKYISL
jgi:hypothetical protein